MTSTTTRSGLAFAAIGIAAAAIAISIAAWLQQPQLDEAPAPQTREFYLLTQVDEEVDEEQFGIPPDLFFPTQMTVNKGDKVLVHFYNLEPEETQEHHTFTMASDPYQMHHDLNAGEQKTIEFAASEAGVYDYICVLHTPTMKGQLIILG